MNVFGLSETKTKVKLYGVGDGREKNIHPYTLVGLSETLILVTNSSFS